MGWFNHQLSFFLGGFSPFPKWSNFEERTYVQVGGKEIYQLPIGSMYGICTYISHKNHSNVVHYSIHGSHGLETNNFGLIDSNKKRSQSLRTDRGSQVTSGFGRSFKEPTPRHIDSKPSNFQRVQGFLGLDVYVLTTNSLLAFLLNCKMWSFRGCPKHCHSVMMRVCLLSIA